MQTIDINRRSIVVFYSELTRLSGRFLLSSAAAFLIHTLISYYLVWIAPFVVASLGQQKIGWSALVVLTQEPIIYSAADMALKRS